MTVSDAMLPTLEAATTAHILALLEARHQPADQWAYFEELRTGTGYGKGAEQRLDAWAMHLWPSHRFARTTFEIKVGRGDFLREIRDPQKRRYGLLYSNLFYFVAPRGLLKEDEIPPECGLIEVWANANANSRGWWAQTPDGLWVASLTVPAPWRDTVPPTWLFFASLVRRLTVDARRSTGEATG